MGNYVKEFMSVEEEDHARHHARPKGWLNLRLYVGEQLVQSHFNRYQAVLILLLFVGAIGLIIWATSR